MSGWPQGWRRRRLVGAVAISALLLLLPAALALEGTGDISSKPLVVRTATTMNIAMSVGGNNPYSYSPNAISNITPGINITIVFTNLGTDAHTFTMSSLVNYTLPYVDNTNLTAFLTQHPAYYTVNIPAGPCNACATASFTAPTVKGSYQFFCTEPGHFELGMQGFLGIDVFVGGGSGPPGIGLPVFIISGVIVGLVIIAIVLGFVVGKREGSKHEMPPERLGYPEMPPEQPPAKPLQ